jgi:uncharacterized protein (AIM24 family)
VKVEEFVSEHGPADTDDQFRLENSYTLDVAVDGTLIAKVGSMVASTGELSFAGQASAEGGITGFIEQAGTEEGTPVMEIEGGATPTSPTRARGYRSSSWGPESP